MMRRCSAVGWSVLCFLLCTGATTTNTAISIVQRNLTVREGEEAVFMCDVPCTHTAFWYVDGFFDSFALPYNDNLPDLTYSRSYSPCNSAGRYNDTLTLLATPELDHAAVQCSASMIDCGSGDDSCSIIIYSRFRILRVESLPDPTPSPPSSSSSSSSSSTSSVQGPTSCPSPSPVVVTSIETSVSTTVSTETVTSTQTVTDTIQPTPTECPAAETSSDAERSHPLMNRLRISLPTLLVSLSVLAALL